MAQTEGLAGGGRAVACVAVCIHFAKWLRGKGKILDEIVMLAVGTQRQRQELAGPGGTISQNDYMCGLWFLTTATRANKKITFGR